MDIDEEVMWCGGGWFNARDVMAVSTMYVEGVSASYGLSRVRVIII